MNTVVCVRQAFQRRHQNQQSCGKNELHRGEIKGGRGSSGWTTGWKKRGGGRRKGGKVGRAQPARGRGTNKEVVSCWGHLKYNTGLDKQTPRGAEATLYPNAIQLGLGERLMGNWISQSLHVAPCPPATNRIVLADPLLQWSRSRNVSCPTWLC